MSRNPSASPAAKDRTLAVLFSAVALLSTACAGPSTPSGETGALAGPGVPGRASGPPNILLIVVDDLGYGDLGSYGHPLAETPNLDRLAREGVRFTDFYAPSPLCSPSRAALMTGRTPFRTGIQNWIPQNTDLELRAEEITVAELLKAQGYATHHSGKWHLNGGLDDASHLQPDAHGFDDWITLHAFAIPNHRNPTNIFRNRGQPGIAEPLGPAEGYTAEIFASATLDWLEKHLDQGDGRPFFVYFAPPEPHGTIASPREYTDRYAHLTRGEPVPIPNGTDGPPPGLEARGPGEYYANLTWLDAQIGRLLDHLDERGVADDTLVFFTSDNGPVTTDWRHWWEINLYGSTGGLRGRKADLWDGGIRVPAIARWPGHIPAGISSDAVASAYDLLPTLAPVAGFEVPEDRPIDGEDLGRALRGKPFERERPLYWEFDDDRGMHYALRDGRYKLMATTDLARVELYDLGEAPFEVWNLAERRPEETERLLAELNEIAASVADDPLRPEATIARPGYRGD